MRLELVIRLCGGVDDLLGVLSIGNQFLFEVEELALEARVRKDNASLRLHEAHRLEQAPVFFLHQVGNDAGG